MVAGGVGEQQPVGGWQVGLDRPQADQVVVDLLHGDEVEPAQQFDDELVVGVLALLQAEVARFQVASKKPSGQSPGNPSDCCSSVAPTPRIPSRGCRPAS